MRAFGLQQVVGYSSPPYRSETEDEDPVIEHRGVSETKLNEDLTLEQNFSREREYASDQVQNVRDILDRSTS